MTVGKPLRQHLAIVVSLVILAACGKSAEPVKELETPLPTTSTVEHASPTTGPVLIQPKGMPVVVAGDADWSQLMADLYLMSRPDVDVLAIAITGAGMAHCPKGAQNIAGVVAALGMQIPVACGADSPLEGINAFPGSWRANADAFGELELPAGVVSDTTASDLMASTIQRSADKVHVLAHGPLTDLAMAITENPLIVDNIEMITIMGGAFDVPGNTTRNPDADWNFWVDPKAARDVLNSGAPVTLVPLDATNEAPINVFFGDALAENRHEKAAEILHEYVLSDPSVTGLGAYFWDPLTAAIMLEPDLAVFEQRTIRVTDGERSEQGRTEVDPAGVEVRVAVSADGAVFQEHFLSTLNGGATILVTPRQPDGTVVFQNQTCEGTLPTVRPAGRIVFGLANTTDEPAGFGMGTYHESFGREDMLTYAEDPNRVDLNPPQFVEVIHYLEVQARSETVTALELEEGTYWMVCLTQPRSVEVLNDVIVGE